MHDTWLIWSYEHDGWWRPGGWGYTRDLAEAGHYSHEEADRIVANANVVVINEVAVPLAQGATFRPAASLDVQYWRRRAERAETEVRRLTLENDLLRHERDYEEPR